jgi:isopentenyl-diphosphate Delta-isomerase
MTLAHAVAGKNIRNAAENKIMKSELFDIVDENNISFGIKKERSLVHKDGDWHHSVHIYVWNDKNELLVHLRSPFKDLHPNCWDTRFGGHVLAGDTIENTAMKELAEEIGIKVEYEDLVKGMVIKYDGGTNREFNDIFYYKFRKNDNIKFNDNEVVEVNWMSVEDILKSVKNNPDKWSTSTSTIKTVYEYWKKLGHI